MNNTRLLFLTLLCLVTKPASSQENYSIEMHTFWQTQGEQYALEVITDNLANSKINAQIVQHKDYNTLRFEISKRIGSQYPPELSHWIGGEDLKTIADAGNLLSLERSKNEALLSTLYPEVWNEVSFDDKLVGIPVGIHLQSMLIYNAELIDSAWQEAFPSNWKDFLRMLDALENAGIDPYSGSAEIWVVRELLSGILTSIDGLKALQNIYKDFDENGKLLAQLTEAMSYFLTFRKYVSEEELSHSWGEMVKNVIDGNSAMTIIGDFAWSEIKTHAPNNTDNFICSALPGIATAYYGIDIFLAFETAESEWTSIFPNVLDAVLNPINQANYLAYKGGLPVTNDVDISTLNACSQASLDRWNADPKQRFSTPGPRDDKRVGIVNSVLVEIWNNPNITAEDAATQLYGKVQASY